MKTDTHGKLCTCASAGCLSACVLPVTPCRAQAWPDPRLPITRPSPRSSAGSHRPGAAGTSPPATFLPARGGGWRGWLTTAPVRELPGAEGSLTRTQPQRPGARATSHSVRTTGPPSGTDEDTALVLSICGATTAASRGHGKLLAGRRLDGKENRRSPPPPPESLRSNRAGAAGTEIRLAAARGGKDRAATTPGGRRLQLPTSGKVFCCCSQSRRRAPSGADTHPGRQGAGADLGPGSGVSAPGSSALSARARGALPPRWSRAGAGNWHTQCRSRRSPVWTRGPPLVLSHPGAACVPGPFRPARPRPQRVRPLLPENVSPAAVSKSPYKVTSQVPSLLMVLSARRAAPRRRWVGARSEGGRELSFQGGEESRVNTQNQSQTRKVPTLAEVSTPGAPGAGAEVLDPPTQSPAPLGAGAAARGSGGRARGAKIRPPCRLLHPPPLSFPG